MRRPSPEDFAVAAEWLDVNEGEEGEAESCKRVAEWLRHEDAEHILRTECRRAGVSIRAVRAKLRR